MGDDSLRLDGSKKGEGFFGPMQTSDGRYATELSLGFNFDGKNVLAPALVPTLNWEEISLLLAGKKPTEAIIKKAAGHARKRMYLGISPFARDGEGGQYP